MLLKSRSLSAYLDPDRRKTSPWGLRNGVVGLSGKQVRLTEAWCESQGTHGRDVIVFDALQPGFGVRVTPAGRRIFVAQTRVAGKPRRVTIGTWPEKSVVEARGDARAVLADMRAGRDPVAERAVRRRAIAAGELTISDLADRWLAEYVRPKLKPRTASDYERKTDRRLKPRFGHLPVSAIAKDDVVAWHAEMRGVPREANHSLAVLRSMLTFAEDVGLRPPLSNPCRRVRLYREKMRERFLSEEELGRAAKGIAAAERDGKIGQHAAAGLKLALLTGARGGEIKAIEWTHVDFERRIVRLPDSKTNEPRTIHLSDAAVEVIRTVPRIGRFVVAGAKPDEAFRNLTRAWIVVRKRAGLAGVRLHDLRHSYASLAAGQGVSLQMIGTLLGHRRESTTRRYAHLARDAVAAVSDDIGNAMAAAIAKGERASANVIKLGKRKRGAVTGRTAR